MVSSPHLKEAEMGSEKLTDLPKVTEPDLPKVTEQEPRAQTPAFRSQLLRCALRKGIDKEALDQN